MDKRLDLFAATPPLEAKKILFSTASQPTLITFRKESFSEKAIISNEEKPE